MSTNLPDFEKAQYVAEPAAPAAEQGLLETSWDQEPPGGSLGPALLFGVVAAMLGSIAYAAFTIITHIEIGFVALFLGAFIATAMMRGTEGIGGRTYQVIACVLTYLSVCTAYMLEVLWGAHERGRDLSHVNYVKLAGFGIAAPFLALENFVSGAIGLFILFLAIRSAWKVAAGKVPSR